MIQGQRCEIELTFDALKAPELLSNMAKLVTCTENGSAQKINGGCLIKETKSRQSSTPPVRNIFLPPPPKTNVSCNLGFNII